MKVYHIGNGGHFAKLPEGVFDGAEDFREAYIAKHKVNPEQFTVDMFQGFLDDGFNRRTYHITVEEIVV